MAVFSGFSALCWPSSVSFWRWPLRLASIYYLWVEETIFGIPSICMRGRESPEAHITVVIMYITCYHSKCCLWKITSMTPHEALFSFSSHKLVYSAVWVSRTFGKNSNVSRRLLQAHLQINVKGKHSDSITHTRIGVRIPIYNIRD